MKLTRESRKLCFLHTFKPCVQFLRCFLETEPRICPSCLWLAELQEKTACFCYSSWERQNQVPMGRSCKCQRTSRKKEPYREPPRIQPLTSCYWQVATKGPRDTADIDLYQWHNPKLLEISQWLVRNLPNGAPTGRLSCGSSICSSW